MIYYTVIVMDRLVFGLDQADVGKLHGAWNYIGSNSVKKRMKFKKIFVPHSLYNSGKNSALKPIHIIYL